MWTKVSEKRNTINIGVYGVDLACKDILLVRDEVERILNLYPQATFVLIGDFKHLEVFNRFPENQLKYLMTMSSEDTPYLLSQLDILLVPLRKNPFNRSRSDIQLVHAGVRAIPWIASSIPSYVDWGQGGVFAERSGEWFNALEQMINVPELMSSFGSRGEQKAAKRESKYIGKLWKELIEEYL